MSSVAVLDTDRASKLLLLAMILRDSERKFSSTQVDIRGETEKKILEFGHSIPEDQLYISDEEDGVEENVHVTIKYGLHEEDVQPVRDLLEGIGPIEITLGRLAMFESEKYDVLYIQVFSEDLHRLNSYISDSMEVTDTHATYTPHCTIAYMKKGCAVHYLGDDRFDGIVLGLDSVTFGSVNGKDTTFKVTEGQLHPEWSEGEGGIFRVFTFSDRRKLASFISSVFKHANTVNHHPDVKTDGDSVRVSYCTHSQNDEVTSLDYQSARVVDMLGQTYGVRELSYNPRIARGENSLHVAADKNLSQMHALVLKAFKSGASKINKPRLRAALMSKNRKLAAQAVQEAHVAVENSLRKSLPGVLEATLREGGKAGVRMLKQRLGIRAAAASDDEDWIDWEFDDQDELAAEWVEKHGAELAKGLSQTSQDEIKDALQDAFEGGDLDEAIDLIVKAVGDPDRADMIARTELMRASNEGQRQAWSQAVDDGLLTGDERKTWIATEVGACDECDALDGETTDLDGEYPGEGGEGPPLHPRCRCTEGIVYGEQKALGGAGSGNFGHEGRPGEKGGSSSASISSILSGEKVGEALGTNPGGVYKTKSGEKWYVKEYKTKEQAYGEHLSNALYHEVGVGAPKSVVEEHNGKTVYASKWLPDSKGILQDVGLDKKNANKVLDGFAADAFLANWDAVGTGLDNVMVHHSGDVSRIDSGGSLLHRAQGALKSESALSDVGEWKTLSDPAKAPFYSKVFRKAGVEDADALGGRAVKQIDDLLGVREKHGGWKSFVETHIPKAPKEYKDKVSSVLESRTRSLKDIRARVSTLKVAGGPGSGNFGHEGRPGEVGGSTEGGGAGVPAGSAESKGTGKTKHDSEKVQLALKMKSEGATLAQIKKETGLHPSTTNYYMSKMKAKEAALKGEFIAKPKPSTPSSYYWKKNPETGKYEKTLTGYGKQQQEKEIQEAGAASAKQYAESKGEDPYGIGKQFAEKDKLKELTDEMKKANTVEMEKVKEGKFDEPSSGATLQSANSLSEVATKYGYEWQKKTTGPQAGKYAWFKDGIQVSAPKTQEEKEAAAQSMHFGAGPKSVSPEEHATNWPVNPDVERTLGKNYPVAVDKKYRQWAENLPENQKEAIKGYTGTSYQGINNELREGKSLDQLSTYYKKNAKGIQDALNSAPTPPPPELVWRGLGSLGANSFVSKLGVGDEIELKGFQSTTLNPGTAKSWHHTESIPLLEIKPSKGAYVQSISFHPHEREYILPHGAKYRVKGLANVPMNVGYSGGKKVKVLQLEML